MTSYGAPDAPVGEEVPPDDLPESMPDDLVPPEDLPDAQPSPMQQSPKTSQDLSGEVPNSDLPDDFKNQQYGTPNQQVLTEVEGFARGALPFGISTAVEQSLSALGVPNLSDQDIAGRQETNPWESGGYQALGLGTSLGLGALGTAGIAAEIGTSATATLEATRAAQAIGKYGQAGAQVLGKMVSGGLIQGSNEISDWLLGGAKEVPADAAGSAMAVGIAAAMNGLAGVASPLVTAGLGKLTEETVTGKLLWFLNGVHAAAEKTVAENADPLAGEVYGDAKKAYDYGKEIFTAKILAPQALFLGHAYSSYKENDSILSGLTTFAEDELGLAFAKRIAAPVILKAITSENGPASWGTSIAHGLQQGINMVHGTDSINRGVENVMRSGTTPGIEAFKTYSHRLKERQTLDDQIKSNAFGQSLDKQMQQDAQQNPVQNYADGGEVKNQKAPIDRSEIAPVLQNNGLASIYPKQAMIMATAKARISAYLSKLRPEENPAKLAFDDKPDTTAQKRDYHAALDIANKPLSVLDSIRKGTIEKSHIDHLQAMYPETTDVIRNKFTRAITEAQIDGKKPSYHIRQGLSLLMGTPLSSELTQPYIAAAQAVFAPSQPQGQPPMPGKNKKSTSTLTKASGQFLTGAQARVMDQQKQD